MARILIVEDNPANLKLASLLLRNADHTVLCAVDAETGLALARTELPDLILMDIQLPGMDGLAATEALKLDPVTAAIPVIALTAMAMKVDEEKSQVAGCDAYIAKPLHYRELYAAIDTLLDKRNAHAGDAATSLTAPRRSGGRTGAVEPPSREEAVRGHRLVLVVDDNRTNQELISLQLALLGFAADTVGSGSAALDQWRSDEHALVLTDLHMPGMDGYALASAIRARERPPHHVPIVGLSASASKREADRSRTSGMDDYLGKPMQLAQLKAALDRWLPAVASRPHPGIEAVAMDGAPSAVDVRVLEGLIGHEPGVVREFLRDFRSGAESTALKLQTACADHDAAQAIEQAHKLMSSARAVGALQLGQLCERMAAAGRARDPAQLVKLWPVFERELGAVIACLDRLQA